MQLDLGQSFRYNEPVIQVIADRFPVSIYYGLVTAFFTYAICIPLGIVKAIKHRTPVDNLTSVLIFIGYAIPGFALGAVLVNILAVQFQIFPLGGFQSPDAAEHAASLRGSATSSGTPCCRSSPIWWARSRSRPC